MRVRSGSPQDTSGVDAGTVRCRLGLAAVERPGIGHGSARGRSASTRVGSGIDVGSTARRRPTRDRPPPIRPDQGSIRGRPGSDTQSLVGPASTGDRASSIRDLPVIGLWYIRISTRSIRDGSVLEWQGSAKGRTGTIPHRSGSITDRSRIECCLGGSIEHESIPDRRPVDPDQARIGAGSTTDCR